MQHVMVAPCQRDAFMFDIFYKMSMLTAECHQVIGMRFMKAMTGGDMIGQEAAR